MFANQGVRSKDSQGTLDIPMESGQLVWPSDPARLKNWLQNEGWRFELLLGEEPPAMGSLPRYGFLELDANIHQAGDALR